MAYTMSTRSLYITDLSGRNLPDEKKIGKQSPYIKFEVGEVVAKTSKDSKGGSNPSWDDEVRLEIPAGSSELSVYVYSDHTLLPDKLVAQGHVMLSNASSGTTTVNLVDKSGNKDAGELFMRLSGDFGGSTGNTYGAEDQDLAGRTSNMGLNEGYGTGAATGIAAGTAVGTAVGTAPTYSSGYDEGRTTDTYNSGRDGRTTGGKVKDTLGMGQSHHHGHGTEGYGRTGTDVGGATIGRGYEDPTYNRGTSDISTYDTTGTNDDRTTGEKVKDTLGMGHHHGHGTEGYGKTGADVGGATIGRGYEDPTYNRGTSDTSGYGTTGTYTQSTGQGYDSSSGYNTTGEGYNTTSGVNTSGMNTDTRSDNRTFVEKAKDAVGMGNKDSQYDSNQGMRGSEYGTGYTQSGTQDNRTFVEKAKDAVGMGGRKEEYETSGYTGTGMTTGTGMGTGTGIATGTYTSSQPMSGNTGYDATRGNEGYDRYDTNQGTAAGYGTTRGTDTYTTGSEYNSGRDNRGLGEKVKDTLGMGQRDTRGTDTYTTGTDYNSGRDNRGMGEKVKDTLGMGQRDTTSSYDDRTSGDKVKDTLGMGGKRTNESDYSRGYDDNVSGQRYGTGMGGVAATEYTSNQPGYDTTTQSGTGVGGMGTTDYDTTRPGYDTTTQGQTYTSSDMTPGQGYSTTGTQDTGMGSDRFQGQEPHKQSSIVDKVKSVVGIPVGEAAEQVGRGTVMNEKGDQYDSRVDQSAYKGTSYPGQTTGGQYSDATQGQGYSTTESYGTGIGQAKDASREGQAGHKGGILDKVKAAIGMPTAADAGEQVGTGQKHAHGTGSTTY